MVSMTYSPIYFYNLQVKTILNLWAAQSTLQQGQELWHKGSSPHLNYQQKLRTALLLGPLPPMWENHMDIQTTGCGLDLLWVIGVNEEIKVQSNMLYLSLPPSLLYTHKSTK